MDTSGPALAASPGSRVRIKKGDLVNDECTATVANLSGRSARIDGRPYIANGGANKGKAVQPVKIEGTNTLVGVPTDQLEMETGSRGHSSPRIGPVLDERTRSNWDRIFGKRSRQSS